MRKEFVYDVDCYLEYYYNCYIKGFRFYIRSCNFNNKDIFNDL